MSRHQTRLSPRVLAAPPSHRFQGRLESSRNHTPVSLAVLSVARVYGEELKLRFDPCWDNKESPHWGGEGSSNWAKWCEVKICDFAHSHLFFFLLPQMVLKMLLIALRGDSHELVAMPWPIGCTRLTLSWDGHLKSTLQGDPKKKKPTGGL